VTAETDFYNIDRPQYGTIVEFEMPIDKNTKVRKGFGFITFEREDAMKELIQKKRVTIGEFTVDLRKATPKAAQGGGAWGPGMGYGGPGNSKVLKSLF
jgi:RNA recognition motif-containing protein